MEGSFLKGPKERGRKQLVRLSNKKREMRENSLTTKLLWYILKSDCLRNEVNDIVYTTPTLLIQTFHLLQRQNHEGFTQKTNNTSKAGVMNLELEENNEIEVSH